MKFLKVLGVFLVITPLTSMGGGSFLDGISVSSVVAVLYLIFSSGTSPSTASSIYKGGSSKFHYSSLVPSSLFDGNNDDDEERYSKKKRARSRYSKNKKRNTLSDKMLRRVEEESWKEFYKNRPRNFRELRTKSYLNRGSERDDDF